LSAHFVTVRARSRALAGPANPRRHPQDNEGVVTPASFVRHAAEPQADGTTTASWERHTVAHDAASEPRVANDSSAGVTPAAHGRDAAEPGVMGASHAVDRSGYGVTQASRGRHAGDPQAEGV